MPLDPIDPRSWTPSGTATLGESLAPWRGLPQCSASFPTPDARLSPASLACKAGERLRAAFVVGATAGQVVLDFRHAPSGSTSTLSLNMATGETLGLSHGAGRLHEVAVTDLTQGRRRIEVSLEVAMTGDVAVGLGAGLGTPAALTLHGGVVVRAYRPRTASEIVAADPKPTHLIYVDPAGAGPGQKIVVSAHASLAAAWAAAKAAAFPSLQAALSGIRAGTAVALRGGASAAAPINYDGVPGQQYGWTLNAAMADGSAPVWLVCDGPPGSAQLRTETVTATAGLLRRALMLDKARRVRIHNLAVQTRIALPWLGGDSTAIYALGSEGAADYDPAAFASVGRDDLQICGCDFGHETGRGTNDLLKLNKLDGALVAGCTFTGGTLTLTDGGTKTVTAIVQEAFDNVTVFNLEVAWCGWTGAHLSPFNFKDGSLNLYFHHNTLSVQAYRSKAQGAAAGQYVAAQGFPRGGGTGWSMDGIGDPGRDTPRYAGVRENGQTMWAESANGLVTDNEFVITRADVDGPASSARQLACFDVRSSRNYRFRRNFFGGADRAMAILMDSERTGWSRDQIAETAPGSGVYAVTATIPAALLPYLHDTGNSGGTPSNAPYRVWRSHGVTADASNVKLPSMAAWGQRAAGDGLGPIHTASDISAAMADGAAPPPSPIPRGPAGWDRSVIRAWLGLA